MLQRKVFTSGDMANKMKLLKKNRLEVFSFFPIDKGDCDCASLISEWKDKLKMMSPNQREAEIEKIGHLTCPRAKESGMKRYTITCENCGQTQGYCYSKNASLVDWVDFHYLQWTNGEEWKGCLTPNISPITQQLTLECTCGQDTRDFRANMTLPGKVIADIENKNKKGREFNKSDSKFKVTVMKGKN